MGDANISSEAPYAQVNAGISHGFALPDGKPVTVRFDVVNLFDTIYEIRDGSGIGVFAPSAAGPLCRRVAEALTWDGMRSV
jgi:hypothetical protein